ncbi:MAG: hypothetical protein M0P04_02700 [Syntrophales bacterium]|nr:hypothetical protein [Syntrophales bacterium]MDD4339472.1 hypothetical protein [Syntrophales bacterium]HOG08448.1 hypothetical protein [Syntrophales bacterium]HPB70700.1 hypothetical protein [Syntrophales bacterium]HQN25856.1 hypothetical protein [Syntrophales bacterium]
MNVLILKVFGGFDRPALKKGHHHLEAADALRKITGSAAVIKNGRHAGI